MKPWHNQHSQNNLRMRDNLLVLRTGGMALLLVAGLYLTGYSQDLSNIAKEKPIRISGSIGTSNSFYTTTSTTSYRAPFSNNFYANLNLTLYGIDIPFSFYYSNNNRGFSHPFLNYGMSPKYKALQLHLGYRSMNLSPMVYQHQTFLGVGAEFNWKFLRLAAFKGSLNQARNMGDGAPRPSMFHRDAIGVKAGLGNSKNFFDLIAFAAVDDTLSLNDTVITNKLLPKENVVLGGRFQLTFGRFLTLTADLAGSAYNENARMDEIVVPELDPLNPWFKFRTGSRISYAGDIRATFRVGKMNAMLQYKKVHPEYYSLGVPYFANNLEMAGINLNTSLFKNRVMLSGSLFGQQDNLLKNQLYMNRNLVFNASSTVRMSDRFNVTLSYNGYSQQQMDGTMEVIDSVRVNRLNHNISFIPNYIIQNEQFIHTISGNMTLTQNMDRNPFTANDPDQQTLTGGLQYHINLKKSKYTLSTNWNHTETSAPMFNFTSDNIGIGAGKRFLKDGNLNIQLNTNMAFTQVEGLSRNRSMVTALTAGYTYKKNHSATLRLNYNRLNNYNLTASNVLNGQDLLVSLSYTYRFQAFDKTKETRANGATPTPAPQNNPTR